MPMTDSGAKRAKKFERLSFKCAGGKFKCGRVYVSSVCRDAICKCGADIRLILQRHATGDWGILPESERRKNDERLSYSRGVLKSFYIIPGGGKIAVMTSVERMETAVFLVGENARLASAFEGI